MHLCSAFAAASVRACPCDLLQSPVNAKVRQRRFASVERLRGCVTSGKGSAEKLPLAATVTAKWRGLAADFPSGAATWAKTPFGYAWDRL